VAILGFPDPVNEKAARAVAGQELLVSVLTLALSAVSPAWLWLVAALAAGFLARVLTGPTLSPFGQLATRVLAPRLGRPKPVAGAPKRFAQGIGLAVTGSATVLLAAGYPGITQLLLAVLVVASGLEAIFAFCLGCHAFGLLMRIGLVPERICLECADISARLRADVAA
jgi:hypothetical protein